MSNNFSGKRQFHILPSDLQLSDEQSQFSTTAVWSFLQFVSKLSSVRPVGFRVYRRPVSPTAPRCVWRICPACMILQAEDATGGVHAPRRPGPARAARRHAAPAVRQPDRPEGPGRGGQLPDRPAARRLLCRRRLLQRHIHGGALHAAAPCVRCPFVQVPVHASRAWEPGKQADLPVVRPPCVAWTLTFLHACEYEPALAAGCQHARRGRDSGPRLGRGPHWAVPAVLQARRARARGCASARPICAPRLPARPARPRGRRGRCT